MRETLGLQSGEEIEFYEHDGTISIRKALTRSPFDKWVGYLNSPGKRTDAVVDELRGQ